MRVLIACEYSGVTRDAFAKLGHYAMSCDLEESDRPGLHYQGDVRDIIDNDWDLMIAHPPCRYLGVSGIHWNSRGRGWHETNKAIHFVALLMNANIERICLENPVSLISTMIRPSDQRINPWQFGHGEKKRTCLWLKNLPLLRPTLISSHRHERILNLPPSKNRAKLRSRTYQGIADAMASQWGNLK